MSGANLRNGAKNVADARENLLECFCGRMTPPDGKFLHEWHTDMMGYSNGRELEADHNEITLSNGRPTFATWAKYILRHIYFSFNLSLEQIGPLWVSFYALIMRRPIPNCKFLSNTSIWNNVMSLWQVDNLLKTKRFIKKAKKETQHGFQIYIYFSADDSKHFDQNRHVFIVSDFEEKTDTEYVSVPFEPTFRLVSVAPNPVKSQAFQRNTDALIEMLGVEGAALLNGGTNDNANDAQREISDTIQAIQTRVEESPHENIRGLNYINGVRRRPICNGNPYHIDNLGVMHASKGMAGDTVNAEHEQIHHRQTLMTMHSLHSDDRDFSQAMMDRVMAG